MEEFIESIRNDKMKSIAKIIKLKIDCLSNNVNHFDDLSINEIYNFFEFVDFHLSQYVQIADDSESILRHEESSIALSELRDESSVRSHSSRSSCLSSNLDLTSKENSPNRENIIRNNDQDENYYTVCTSQSSKYFSCSSPDSIQMNQDYTLVACTEKNNDSFSVDEKNTGKIDALNERCEIKVKKDGSSNLMESSNVVTCSKIREKNDENNGLLDSKNRRKTNDFNSLCDTKEKDSGNYKEDDNKSINNSIQESVKNDHLIKNMKNLEQKNNDEILNKESSVKGSRNETYLNSSRKNNQMELKKKEKCSTDAINENNEQNIVSLTNSNRYEFDRTNIQDNHLEFRESKNNHILGKENIVLHEFEGTKNNGHHALGEIKNNQHKLGKTKISHIIDENTTGSRNSFQTNNINEKREKQKEYNPFIMNIIKKETLLVRENDYRVSVKHIEDLNNFYVVVINDETKELYKNYEEMGEFYDRNEDKAEYSVEPSHIHEDMFVAVKHESPWYRGKIEQFMLQEKEIFAEIYLCDFGKLVKKKLNEIRYLDSQFNFPIILQRVGLNVKWNEQKESMFRMMVAEQELYNINCINKFNDIFEIKIADFKYGILIDDVISKQESISMMETSRHCLKENNVQTEDLKVDRVENSEEQISDDSSLTHPNYSNIVGNSEERLNEFDTIRIDPKQCIDVVGAQTETSNSRSNDVQTEASNIEENFNIENTSRKTNSYSNARSSDLEDVTLESIKHLPGTSNIDSLRNNEKKSNYHTSNLNYSEKEIKNTIEANRNEFDYLDENNPMEEAYHAPDNDYKINTDDACQAVFGYRDTDDQRLCKFGTACRKSKCYKIHQNKNEKGITSEIATLCHKTFDHQYLLEIGQKISIYVTSIIDIGRFYAIEEYIEMDEDRQTLEDLMRIMNEKENILKYRKFTFPPSLSQLVLAPSNDVFYRGQIMYTNEEENDLFLVYFVDFGTSQLVELKHLREYEQSYNWLPFQAREFSVDSYLPFDVHLLSENHHQLCFSLFQALFVYEQLSCYVEYNKVPCDIKSIKNNKGQNIIGFYLKSCTRLIRDDERKNRDKIKLLKQLKEGEFNFQPE